MSELFLKLTSGPFVNIYAVSMAIQEGDISILHSGFGNKIGHFLSFSARQSQSTTLSCSAQISAFQNLLNSDRSSAKHTLKTFSADGLGKGGGKYRPHCSEVVPTDTDHQC